MFLFLYPPEPQGSFLHGVAHATVRERFNIISSCLTARFRQVVVRCVTARFAKTVEKSGNVWYNELKSEGKLPYKSEFYEVKNNENKAISK